MATLDFGNNFCFMVQIFFPLKLFLGQNVFIEVLAGSWRTDHFEYRNLKLKFQKPPLPLPFKEVSPQFYIMDASKVWHSSLAHLLPTLSPIFFIMTTRKHVWGTAR